MLARILVVFLVFFVLNPDILTAQVRTPVLVGRETPIDTARALRQASGVRAVTTRSLSALAGGIVGAYAGFYLGDTYTPRNESDTDFGDRAITGAAIGYFLGTAVGAALPSYQSPCSFSTRFWRGLGGSVIGLVPAVVVGPIGPSVGAAALQGRC